MSVSLDISVKPDHDAGVGPDRGLLYCTRRLVITVRYHIFRGHVDRRVSDPCDDGHVQIFIRTA
jgi:hypothetical protein